MLPNRRLAVALAFALAGAGARPATAALVINEVLYDPAGADRGAEWVEIHNTGPWPATLEGLALEAGDGSGPGRWTRAWSGSPGTWIDAGGFCLIGGSCAGTYPCLPGVLDLQNGPDGVRLLREGIELDRVGWGDLVGTEYCEGLPAPAVSSGHSLARLDDGIDTEDNRSDFAEATPTPGACNHPRRNLAVQLRSPGPGAPLPEGPAEAAAVVRLENTGSAAVPADEIGLVVADRRLLPVAGVLPDSFRPGGVFEWKLSLACDGDPGLREWVCRVELPGDQVPVDDADTLSAWAGPAPLRFSEIAPHPVAGGTEWIELEAGDEAVPTAGWSLRDRSGSCITLRGLGVALPRARVLVVRDSAVAVAAGWTTQSWAGAWPTLNDTAPKGEAADTLWLLDPSGVVADRAVYGATREGASWVRDPGAPVDAGLEAWLAVEPVPGPTPGAPNQATPASVRLPAAGDPAVLSFSRNPGGAWITLEPARDVGWRTARLLALDGSVAAEFESAGSLAGSSIRWDGTRRNGEMCPAGCYLLEVRDTRPDGAARVSRRVLLVGR